MLLKRVGITVGKCSMSYLNKSFTTFTFLASWTPCLSILLSALSLQLCPLHSFGVYLFIATTSPLPDYKIGINIITRALLRLERTINLLCR